MARKSSINREKIQQRADKYIARGKLLDAINELQLLVDDNPSDMNTVNKVGDLYVRAGKIPEAIAEFTKISESYCDDGFILKAIAIYKKINKLDPANMPIYQRLADLYLTQGLTMEAKSQYQVIGDHYFKEGRVRDGLEIYNKVIELDPNNIKVRARVADYYQKEGLTDKALHEYLVIGHKLVSKGMFKEAIAVFERARRIDAQNPHALKGMAIALTQEGNHGDAIPLLRDLLKVDPSNLEMLELLGQCLMETGHLPEAERVIMALYEQDLTARERVLDLYRVYLRNNEVKSAFRCLQVILPAIVEEGAVDAAVAYIRDVLRRAPKLVPALESLAKIHESRDQEVELLNVQSALVDAYVEEGNKEQAVAILQELMRADPLNAQHQARLVELGAAAPPAPPPAAARPAPPRPKPAPQQAPVMEMVEFVDEIEAVPDDSSRAGAVEPHDEVMSIDLPEVEIAEVEEITIQTGPEPDPAGTIVEESIEFIEIGDETPIEPEIEEVAADFDADDALAAEAAQDPFIEEIDVDDPFQDAVEELPVSFEEPLSEHGGSRRAEDDEREKFIAEHVTEAEVFAKYGLTDRAIDQLKTITARYPDAEEAHLRLKELFVDKQDPMGAATECILLSDIHRMRGDTASSRALLQEARDLAPNHPLLEEEEDEAPAPPPVIQAPPMAREAEPPPRPIPAPPARPSPPSPTAIPPPAAAPPPVTPTSATAPRPASRAAEATPTEPAPRVTPPLKDPPAAAPRPARSAKARRADELLASLEAQVRKPAARSDPLKAVDDLLSSISAKPKPTRRPEPPEPPVPPREPAPAMIEDVTRVREEEPVEIVDESLSDVFGDEQRFMDMASDLSTDLASLVSDSGGLGDEAPESDATILSDIFNEFKKGVDEQLDAHDYETRYNLGIAYKEMGLVDEAIREFQVASADSSRSVECCSMLGLCFMEKGDAESAASWFKRGLGNNGQTPEQILGLHYDLGQALEMMGDHAGALDAFRKVHSRSPNHRNVAERIRRLEQAPAS